MDNIEKLLKYTGFEWDKDNIEKNWLKHKVTPVECEQVFFNKAFFAEDVKYSQQEKRYYALGLTNNRRLLFIAFTIRRNLIRVISARNMSKKERKIYEEQA
jgi:uncharacterized DUF497 family protein